MAFESFRSIESDRTLTTPNAMTAARAVGGVVLGIGMTRYNLDPGVAVAAVAGLAATDAEGTLIKKTQKYPRLQRMLRIIPSSLGRITDPIADKLFTTSIFIAGMVNGAIPIEDGAGVMVAETAVVGVTAIATASGNIPEVSKVGKAGMITRCSTIIFDLTAAATENVHGVHEVMQYGGHTSAAAAVVLGGLSAWKISRQS